MWNKKTYSILNFVCLSFGLTCAIIVMLYIRNTYSFDKFHVNYNRIYAVDAYVTYFNGDRFPKQLLSASLSELLKVNAPEIEEMTRVAERQYSIVSGDKSFSEKGIYADDNFFRVFTFPVISGSSDNLLSDPNSVMISSRLSVKLFGNTDCSGKSLVLKNEDKIESYKITGVFKDVPSQSTLQFDFIIPFTRFLTDNKWAVDPGATACFNWIVLKNSSDRRLVADKIKNLIRNQESTLNQELFLFPLKEQVLYSYASGHRVWRQMQYVFIAGAIGLAILLIACFNYINLAIAMNLRRYKEAGYRKVAGSSKTGIILQFLGETFILTFISLLIAIILSVVLLPVFNRMFNYSISFHLFEPAVIIFFVAVTFFTSFISGIIPAVYLASANSVNTMKGVLSTGHSYRIFRQSLIVLQFTIPVVLIIWMMIIKAQDKYMRSFDAGIDKNKVIIVDNTAEIGKHTASIRADLMSVPGIEAVSFTNCIPTRGAGVSNDVSWEGKDAAEKLHFWCVKTDFEYNKTVKINITEGRFFSNAYLTDSSSYIINDVAAKVMKKSNPVGSSITVEGRKGTIIGVFKDFHAIDLAGPIVPTIVQIRNDDNPMILIKYSSGSYQSISDKIRGIYSKYEHDRPYHATLFRDLVPYGNLDLSSGMVAMAFIIALLLACMGLFGLASFTAENRTKEIGIRKASGATTQSVMRLLLSGYTKWLTISFCIAIPIAFIIGKNFLGRFYFHTPIPVWAFIAGPVITVIVALLTVSSQAWNVASRNPVKSLRYE